MNVNFDRQYKGMPGINNYGSDSGGKGILAKKDTIQTTNNVGQYGENVTVEFSGEGMAALGKGKEIMQNDAGKKENSVRDARNTDFAKEIIDLSRSASYLPEYSGIYEVDKAIATALENGSEEEQGFVYDIIRQNFLVADSSTMTEEERQANISLGMKKAEYAAENMVPEGQKAAFLDAMETVAKLAAAGRADEDGKMNYGVSQGSYLGNGSNLKNTTNSLEMMKQMDPDAYAEYEKISRESSNEDRPLNTLRHLTQWAIGAATSNPNMVAEYEQNAEKYIKENVKNQKLDMTFGNISTESKSAFMDSLKMFQSNHPNFLGEVLNREVSLQFWNR